MFLKILQNSQGNTCAGVYFNKDAGLMAATLLKKNTLAQVLSCEFWEIFKKTSGRLLLWFLFNKLAKSCKVKVLEYLHKTKTLKMPFFLGQSFAIGLKQRHNMFFNKNDAFKRTTSRLCFFMFFRANVFQVKLDNISFLFKFNLTSH